LAIGNLAWIISQAISGAILSYSSLSFLYFIAFIIMALFFSIAFLGLRNISDPKYDKILVWQSFKNFFRNKNLTRAYTIISFYSFSMSG